MGPAFRWVYEDGGLSREQLDILLTVAMLRQPETILEVGTFMGQTTYALAVALPKAHIFTVDLPLGATVEDAPGQDKHLVERRDVGRAFRGSGCAERITQYLEDTLTWNFKGIGSPDFFFIDGAHTYEACRNDSEKSLARATPGSVFIWHDYDERHPGVVRVLNEWRQRLNRNVRQLAGTPFAYWVYS
jgi:predicted O-methyltransferase YrrM